MNESKIAIGAVTGRVLRTFVKCLPGVIPGSVLVLAVPAGLLFLAFDAGNIALVILTLILAGVALVWLYAAVIHYVWAQIGGSGGSENIWNAFSHVAKRILPVMGVGVLVILASSSIGGVIVALIWLLALPIVVIEADQPAMRSFGRSATLLAHNLWRVFWVQFLVALVLLAAYLLVLLVVSVIGSTVVSVIVFALVVAAVMPLNMVFSTVIYADRLGIAEPEAATAVPPAPPIA